MKKISTVEEYLSSQKQWEQELQRLREIIQSSGLDETIKWGAPVYTHQGKNVVGMGAFKSYVGLWFFQGALLKDTHRKLISAQEGKTKALRQWRFQSLEEINADAELIHAYIQEAIANLKSGKEIKPDRQKSLELPDELKSALETNPELKRQFETFTPGKQREFAEYISEAKRPETRQKRLEKVIPLIQAGVGLYDKYKK